MHVNVQCTHMPTVYHMHVQHTLSYLVGYIIVCQEHVMCDQVHLRSETIRVVVADRKSLMPSYVKGL